MSISKEKTGRKGFTVIEALLVVAIISVLTAAAVPRLNRMLRMVRREAAEREAHLVLIAVMEYFQDLKDEGQFNARNVRKIVNYPLDETTNVLTKYLGGVMEDAVIESIYANMDTAEIYQIVFVKRKERMEINLNQDTGRYKLEDRQ